MLIRPLEHAELDSFFAYLNDHLSDNGIGATALFMPMPRSDSRFPPEKEAAFRTGLATPMGEPGWRRAFLAIDDAGNTIGHIDLRARPERTAAHRALLGMGVHRDARRQGLGQRLVEFVLDWARAQQGIDWVDLDVLAVNTGARKLYQRCGFQQTGEVADMYRIDGDALAYVSMTLRV